MHSNNVFNMLRIAKMLNLARKIVDEISRENIVTKVNCSERKKSIKIIFDIQKIMQRDNASNYYQLSVCEIEKAQIQIRNDNST